MREKLSQTKSPLIGHNSRKRRRTRGKYHGFRLRERGGKQHAEVRRKGVEYFNMSFPLTMKLDQIVEVINQEVIDRKHGKTLGNDIKALKKYTVGKAIHEWRTNHQLTHLREAKPTWLREDMNIVAFQNEEKAICRLPLSDATRITDGFKLMIQRRINEGKVEPYTITRECSGIRTIFRRMADILFILEGRTIAWTNPICSPNIDWPKDVSGRKRFLEIEDDIKLYDAITKWSKTERQRRKWIALVTTAIVTGLRRKVLCNLKWQDIDYRNQVIRVSKDYWEDGKPAPELVPLTTKLAKELKLYSDVLPEDRRQPTSFVFQPEKKVQPRTRKNFDTDDDRVRRKQMNKEKSRQWADIAFRRIVQEQSDLCEEDTNGEKDWITFHCLRHTMATRYVNRPYSIGQEAVDYLLGINLNHKYAHKHAVEWCDDIRKAIEEGDEKVRQMQGLTGLSLINGRMEQPELAAMDISDLVKSAKVAWLTTQRFEDYQEMKRRLKEKRQEHKTLIHLAR